jgi:hypothetical protein
MSRFRLDPIPATSSKPASAESGQAIVFMALSMIVFIGMVGLAVDGGRTFFMYRDAQSATDAAALAAAYAICVGSDDPIAAGERSAMRNGFVDGEDDKSVTIERAPDWADDEAAHDDPNYIGVTISDTAPTFFIQMVYDGPIEITTRSVTHCNPGGSGNGSESVHENAFQSLAEPGECSAGSPGFTFAGSGLDVYGNIWTPSINGNVEFHNDRVNVYGDIQVGTPKSHSHNTQHETQGGQDYLVEKPPGDGTVEYDVPGGGEGTLPYTMDYFRPADSSLCDADSSECGTLQSAHGSSYRDISNWCSHGAVNAQDFNDPGFEYWTGSTLEDGIYYATCPIIPNNHTYQGQITLISEEKIDISAPGLNIRGFGGAPVLVSNKNSGNSSSDCSPPGDYAIQVNTNGARVSGPTIAFQGSVVLQGNAFRWNSCTTARGIHVNGNEGAEYRCEQPPTTGGPPWVGRNQ